ncbi:MAG: hypothetical protein AAB459_03335 [Patescibacteria group bacterium]
MKKWGGILPILLATVIGLVSITSSQKVDAISTASFNANRIIDDAIFFYGNRMNSTDVQSFLNAKVPTCDVNGIQPYAGTTRAVYGTSQGYPPPYTCLKNFIQTIDNMPADAYCSAVSGGTRSAADIITAVGQACGVNPQVILITLQKEQSLITDAWPWSVQYEKATGYACPDTAPCDPTYAGFFHQIYYGARQFKRYILLPNLFNYAIGRSSYVGYNPNSACGGTNLTPNTQATAALYNYTPYQPNAATLAAPEGAEVNCGAYGNLNFWRKFNDWFGPALTNEFAVIMADNGDPTQWVLENGVRYVIPDMATKIAWGLSPKWDSPYIFDGSYINTLQSGATLGRVVRPAGGLDVYFVDSAKKYRFSSAESMAAWGYNSSNVIDVPVGLSDQASTQGDMTYTVSLSGDPRIFIMDGGTLRHVTDLNVLTAWAGDVFNNIPISNDYFSTKSLGSDISETKVTNGSPAATEYQVVAGQKLAQSQAVAQLYPGTAQVVSNATIDRLITSAPASHFVRHGGSSTVYMVDSGAKHAVGSPELLRAWGVGPNPMVNIVTQGNLNLLANGSALTSYGADVNGQLYLMDGRKISVTSGLDSAYRTASVYSPSPALMSLLPGGENASSFIKGFQSAPVYLLDNSILRQIQTPQDLELWGATGSITSVSDYVLSNFLSGSSVGSYVTDGSTEFILESGTKHTISGAVKYNWLISNPVTLSSSTLSRFYTGLDLSNHLRVGGQYYKVHEGDAFMTTDINIANAWGVSGAGEVNSSIVSKFLTLKTLTRFVKSKNSADSRLFVVDNGVLYYLSPEHAANLGLKNNEPRMAVNPEAVSISISSWSAVVVKDSADKHYVIENGSKRNFANSIIQNHWTGNGVLSVPITTNGFLNLLPNSGTIERAIKGNGSALYSAENGTKRWILSSNTFNLNYAPYSFVSDSLINALPTGINIP